MSDSPKIIGPGNDMPKNVDAVYAEARMGDKYEELAREFVEYYLGLPQDIPIAESAMRWLDSKRAAETCECDEWKLAKPQIENAFVISTIHHGATFSAPTFRLCPYCGCRIVEKQAVVRSDEPNRPEKKNG